MKNRTGKSPVQRRNSQHSRISDRRRKLHLESLEERQLLAADIHVVDNHNYLIAEDVNGDFRISAMDALVIINQLNARSSGTSASGEATGDELRRYSDVNRDGRVSAIDALRVINRLNAEGEDPEILITYSYTITNVVNPDDPTMGTPLTQVSVGQQFQINVFVKDNRDPNDLPSNSSGQSLGGVFQAGMDLGVSTLDLATYQPHSTELVYFANSFNSARVAVHGADYQTEFFDEVAALYVVGLFDPRTPSDQVTPFFSARFLATEAGTMTFNPNAPDSPESENALFWNDLAVPDERIDFGSPFSINIVADPNVPVANPDTLVTRRNNPRTITHEELLANDTGVDLPLTVTSISVIAGTTQGTLAGDVYTPPSSSFTGTDTLQYTVRDAANRTSTGTITIDVLPSLVARNDQVTVQTNSSNNILDVRANDEPASVRINLVGTPSEGGSVTISSDGTNLRYTPATDFRGTETFTYRITDNQPDALTRTATVTVTVADRLPAAGSFQVEVDEFTQDNPIDVLEHVVPNEGTEAVLVGIGTQPAHGTVRIDTNGTPDDRTDDFIYYEPNPGFVGTDTFSYVANDTSSPAEPNSTGTVTVVVKEVNFPPILNPSPRSTLEDRPLTISLTSLLANDRPFLEGQNLVPSSVTVAAVSTAGGSVRVQNGNVLYTPSNNFFGEFLFSYTVSDDFVRPLSSTATVTVTVTPVNDPPIIPPASPTVRTFRGFKNVPLNIPVADVLVGVTPGPSNESTQTLSVVAVGPNATSNGSVVGTATLSGNTITFTPIEDFTGEARFDFTVQDNGGTANGGLNTAVGEIIVNVEEFLPSTVSGRAWVDEDRDGQIDPNERFLAGIEVQLTGTSLGQAIDPQTALTLADGSYEFVDIGPGNYQVTFQAPAFMLPSSHYGTSHTVVIAEPGGFDMAQNYAVIGLNAQTAQWMSQLVSHYYYQDPSLAYRGAYFAIGANNSLLWGLKLDGFSDAKFAEAVFDGDALLLTVVGADSVVHTTRIARGHYGVVRDSAGNALVRVLGSAEAFDWTEINRASPPFNVSTYLDAVDAVFSQQGWDDAK